MLHAYLAKHDGRDNLTRNENYNVCVFFYVCKGFYGVSWGHDA